MQKSFKLIVTSLLCFTSAMLVCAQAEVEYKDVILNGKPAKLNIVTGEIIRVKFEAKELEAKTDAIAAKPILVIDSNSNTASSTPEVVYDNDSDFHIVKKDDNLYRISVMYNTSLGELKKANHLETTLIRKGQKLRVRNFDKVYNLENTSLYVVKKGDNLYRIAKENETTVKAIKSLNGLTTDVIKIGQKLQLN